MSLVLGTRRTADLLAATDDTRVLTPSRSCVKRLSQPEDAAQLWKNIAGVLARRLLSRSAR